MVGQEGEGVGFGGDAGAAQRVANHPGQRLAIVEIAGQGGGVVGLFDQAAQARSLAEIAGLEQDQRVAHRRSQESLERVLDRVVGILDQHDAPAAAERNRRGFVGQARRIGGERAGDAGDAEGIGRIGNDGARQGVDALVDQPGIGPIDQNRADRLVGRSEKSADACRRDLHRGPYCPVTGAGCRFRRRGARLEGADEIGGHAILDSRRRSLRRRGGRHRPAPRCSSIAR